jgi:hypothetical protein
MKREGKNQAAVRKLSDDRQAVVRQEEGISWLQID